MQDVPLTRMGARVQMLWAVASFEAPLWWLGDSSSSVMVPTICDAGRSAHLPRSLQQISVCIHKVVTELCHQLRSLSLWLEQTHSWSCWERS